MNEELSAQESIELSNWISASPANALIASEMSDEKRVAQLLLQKDIDEQNNIEQQHLQRLINQLEFSPSAIRPVTRRLWFRLTSAA
ncbi:MAG: hypothetical protein J7497_15720, partial [Chitinophagaceae bacterium]|nr:hypothetical protein [Chitinophagaceae bacterium]